jgi:hypothetical protein
MTVKIITIVHDKDGGFETIETTIEGDAVVVVNFPESKMEMSIDEAVTVRDRDTGQDITDLLRTAIANNPPQIMPTINHWQQSFNGDGGRRQPFLQSADIPLIARGYTIQSYVES